MKNKYIKELTSIVLPTWFPKGADKEKYVAWTLESLASTTDKPFEIIIFNNEAREDTNKFLRGFHKLFSKNKNCKGFKIIKHSKNMGWTGGLELGIQAAKGEYVCFSNDDLVYEGKWLSKMLKHFSKDVALVGPTSDFVSGFQDVRYVKLGDYEERVNFLIGFCILAKRVALDSVIEGPEQYYIDPRFYPGGSEELDLCYRLAKKGWRMLIAKDVFIHHFGNRTLKYYKEFQLSNPEKFFNPRMAKLEQKHGQDIRKILEFQHSPLVAIGIPTIGQIDSQVISNFPWLLQRSWSELGFNNVLPIISPRNIVHIGRSSLVGVALTYGVEYIMFLDDDMLVQDDTLVRLYGYKKDFVSAVAFKRSEPFFPCIFTGKDSKGAWIPDTRLRQGLIEVDVTGLSCCLIKMDIIKEILDKKKDEIYERGGLFYFNRFGEDFNFCEELKSMGVKIFADSDLIVDHIGRTMLVNDRTFYTYNAQQAQLEEQRLKNKGRLNEDNNLNQ